MEKRKLPKALILTYYWPPSGGAGVQRWLKFAKYFRESGWEPVIYTADADSTLAHDESLFRDVPEGIEVLKRPIWEPYNLYKKATGKSKDEKLAVGLLSRDAKKSWKERLSVWIRGNLFIPDARRFWIRPSVKYLSNYLKDNPVEVIISTGPPHTMHMIGMKLKRRVKIPWIADFRDPWTSIDFYHELHLSKWADRKHHRLERKVLTIADKLVAISWHMAEEMKELGAKEVDVITNGFDYDDRKGEKPPLDEKFTISHIGSLNKARNPVVFWEALSELCKNDKDFTDQLQIRLIGSVDQQVMIDTERLGLKENIVLEGQVSHTKALEYQQRAQLLLLLINDVPASKGILSGKLFEYMSSERPVFVIGPEDGDIGRVLKETSAGRIAGFKEKEIMQKIILDYFALYLRRELTSVDSQIDQYSRKKLAADFCNLLNDFIEQ